MSEERTERPTQKKLRQAREQGQVARSRDLTGAIVLVGATALLATGGLGMVDKFVRFAESCFASAATSSRVAVPGQLMEGLTIWGSAMTPYLVCLFGLAFLVSLVQVGPGLSVKSLAPDLNRLNPSRGLKQLFSVKRFVHLTKVALVLLLLIILTSYLFRAHLADLAQMPSVSPISALAAAGSILLDWAKWLLAALLAVGIVDYAIQRKLHTRDLLMTRSEIKRERREQQGDPIYRSQRQRLHRSLLENDLATSMQRATVLVTNPTHLAVALFFDDEETDAPELVAKGRGYVAEQLRRLALEYGVPIVEDVALAHSLVDLEIGEQIPPDLYDAVAEIIRFVYELSEIHAGQV